MHNIIENWTSGIFINTRKWIRILLFKIYYTQKNEDNNEDKSDTKLKIKLGHQELWYWK